MEETKTRLILNVMDFPTEIVSVEEKVTIVFETEEDLNPLSNADFIMGLAYRALEHEASFCTSKAGKQQVAYLLDRLIELDNR